MVAVFILDQSRRCRFMNRIAEDLTGRSDAEGRGEALANLVWRNPLPFAETDLARALAAGAGEGETTVHAKRGAARQVAYRVVPLGGGGPDEGHVVELIDLTGETGTGGALRRSEQRLRMAVEATGIGIWDVNAKTGERQWSPEFIYVLGLPPEASPDDRLFSSLIHPEDRDRVDRAYARAYADGSNGAFDEEFRIHRADDGEERWVAVSGRVAFDRNGKALRGIGTLRDIHERQLSEMAIREREERLRVALVAGRMGTWRTDLATGKQLWDATQYQLMQVDPAVVPSRELFLSLVHPDDRAAVAFDFGTLPKPGVFLDLEFRIAPPDGSVRWIVANSMVRYDQAGKPTEMIGVNRDVTHERESEQELRLSEERHRLAIEANNVGTWDYDVVTGRHQWSVTFKRLWGLPDDAPADPALLHPLVEDKDWEMIRRAWAQAVDPAGDGQLAIEYKIHRPDGEIRWCAFSGKMFFDDTHARVVRALGIVTDVTERKATESRQRLILREMNHRVKNNLAIIQAIVSQTLRTTPNSEAAFERIQSRLASLARTHDFLNNDHWLGIRLRKLLQETLEPFLADTPDRLVLEGPPVTLDSAATLALGLVVHELGANAFKHGALSVPDGRLVASWRMAENGRSGRQLILDWIERNGPRPRRVRTPGFGTRLIEASVRATLGGHVDLDFRPSGLEVHMSFPLAEVEPVLPLFDGAEGDPESAPADAARGP